MEKDMMQTTGFLKRCAVAGAFAVMYGLSGPVLAQDDKTTTKRLHKSIIVIDDLSTTTTGDYAHEVERVVWAKYLSVKVRELGPGVVETYFEFEILETVKGTFANGRKPGTRFIIGTPGGEAGESVTEVQPPFPRFKPGDEVVLLIWGDSPDGNAIISPTKSTYRVHTDAQGRKTVTPRPTGMTLYRARDGSAYERMPGRPALDDFLFSLGKHVAEAGPGASN